MITQLSIVFADPSRIHKRDHSRSGCIAQFVALHRGRGL